MWLHRITVEPPNKGHFGTSHFVFCREVVLFSDVKNVLLQWERGIEQCPLQRGCPFLGGSFIGGSTVILTPCPLYYPARACAARGKVISRGWWCPYVKKKSTVFLEPIFYLSKYSLSELYFNTDRLLIEFNGLWYSLAARQVFVAIANPDSPSFG